MVNSWDTFFRCTKSREYGKVWTAFRTEKIAQTNLCAQNPDKPVWMPTPAQQRHPDLQQDMDLFRSRISFLLISLQLDLAEPGSARGLIVLKKRSSFFLICSTLPNSLTLEVVTHIYGLTRLHFVSAMILKLNFQLQFARNIVTGQLCLVICVRN